MEDKRVHLQWMIKELGKVSYGFGTSSLVSTRYPKDVTENLAYRRQILAKCETDELYREKVRFLFHSDPVFAFNTFFFTLDVRKRPFHNQPFATYPFQDILIQILDFAIEHKMDIPIDKSRDMGLSWIIIGTIFWKWMDPRGGTDFLVGSRIQDYVDKHGDMRTLLQKVRYLLYKLPKWLRPEGFNRNKHDNFMKLVNPVTGASITGESSNPNFSTGGRYAAILYDEFAKWDHDVPAWTAGGDATPCRIPNSTPFGAAGQHYDLVTSDRPFARIHWTLHPEKAEGAYCFFPKEEDPGKPEEGKVRSPWYDAECLRRSSEEVAQELDIDYVGAGALVFSGKASERMRLLLRSTKLPIRFLKPDFGKHLLEEVRVPREFEHHVVLYEEVDTQSCYTIGVDVAEGKEEGDFSVIKVLNRLTGDCAASFYSRLDEILLAKVVELIASLFSFQREREGKKRNVFPWIGIETNGPGLSTFDMCSLVPVPNLFMMPRYDSVTGTSSVSKGWKTTTTSRNILITSVRQWLQDGEGFLDKRATKELTTFIRAKTGKAEAKQGCHDDEVIAWGIALEVSNQVPLERGEKIVEYREDGLPEQIFHFDRNLNQEPTLHERCLATLTEKTMENDALLAAVI